MRFISYEGKYGWVVAVQIDLDADDGVEGPSYFTQAGADRLAQKLNRDSQAVHADVPASTANNSPQEGTR